MNNTLCICIMRQCLIEWLHNMLLHRIKYEIFIRPERALECLVVKSLTREIQLLLLAPSEYVSSLYKKALKATRNFTPKYTIPSWLVYYPNWQEYAPSGAWRDTVKRRSPTSFHAVIVRCFNHQAAGFNGTKNSLQILFFRKWLTWYRCLIQERVSRCDSRIEGRLYCRLNLHSVKSVRETWCRHYAYILSLKWRALHSLLAALSLLLSTELTSCLERSPENMFR